ncbi:MAG: ATP synthase F1 subunit gamma [Bacteroidales bacterium]|nr:ATP synthase F1 subunit gamma [Bacteroidales bacterium]
MGNLKEIRTRIASVNSTRQITSAMKMVSAAKLRRAQDAIVKMRPYATKLHEILVNITSNLDSAEDNIYAQQRNPEKVLIVVITSNKGLCGAFNANVVKQAVKTAENEYANELAAGNVWFYTLGKKAFDGLKGKNLNVINGGNKIFEKLNFETASEISTVFMQEFHEGKYDRIDIVYNQFKNAAVQILSYEQYLPVKIESGNTRIKHDFIFEPSKELIIHDIIPKSLKIHFYKALLDSHAAEHGARMTAMHKATDNAFEILKELKLQYNKARQATITNEIIEIVGGAEALSG